MVVNIANSRGMIVFKLRHESWNFLENLAETIFVQFDNLKIFTTSGTFDDGSCNMVDMLNFMLKISNYKKTKTSNGQV